MAYRAGGEEMAVAQTVLLGELPAALELVGRGLPFQIEDLLPRAKVPVGLAMAVEAPLHEERGNLVGEGHLIDAPVAAGAADSLVDVDAVVEVDETGEIVDPLPAQRVIALVM
jgi:hypothetical protein